MDGRTRLLIVDLLGHRRGDDPTIKQLTNRKILATEKILMFIFDHNNFC